MSEGVKALLVVDMQRDFVEEGAPLEVPRAREILLALQAEIRYFRDRRRCVLYVVTERVDDDPEFRVWPRHAVRGTRGAEIQPAVRPAPEDTLVAKQTYSAFHGTELDAVLRRLGVTDVHITGVATETSILLTAADALMLGYRVVVPETCVAGLDESAHAAALRLVREVLKPRQRA